MESTREAFKLEQLIDYKSIPGRITCFTYNGMT